MKSDDDGDAVIEEDCWRVGVSEKLENNLSDKRDVCNCLVSEKVERENQNYSFAIHPRLLENNLLFPFPFSLF